MKIFLVVESIIQVFCAIWALQEKRPYLVALYVSVLIANVVALMTYKKWSGCVAVCHKTGV